MTAKKFKEEYHKVYESYKKGNATIDDVMKVIDSYCKVKKHAKTKRSN